MSLSDPRPDTPEVVAAIQAIEDYWVEMGQRWPWMRQLPMQPVYLLTAQTLIDLTRHFPTLIHSNQARWYARQVAGQPSIYALPRERYLQEAQHDLRGTGAQELDGKNAVTLLYLANVAGKQTPAKTLLLSTEKGAPLFRAQLAHELLNCACSTDFDGQVLRAGVRNVNYGTGVASVRGGNLNDLLIDTLLLDFLPATTNYTRATLLDGQQGPYWHIAAALSAKIPQNVILDALFGVAADSLVLNSYLNQALERGDASSWIDARITARDWSALTEAIGTTE